jgi:Right handed beta helix region
MKHLLGSVPAVILMAWVASAGAVEFYVAPDGDDSQAGTAESPFATLERARDAVRQAGQEGEPATVYLRGGVYARDKTFALSTEDSGSSDAPVVYRAFEKEEVHLSGGQAVSGFEPVKDAAILARLPESARTSVLQADLKAQGIAEFGTMTMRGFPQPIVPAPLELFYDGAPMTLARWPNADWAITGPIIDTGSIPRNDDHSNRPGIFEYKDDRPERWTDADDIWMFGYWCWDWADEYIRVASIDTEKRQITFAAPHHYGLKEGMRYYALNLLEELDQPGEWYLDRTTGHLYFWPPGPIDGAEVAVSLLEHPMVTMREVSHVAFQGITFEYARGIAMQMLGGTQNRVTNCTFRNIGDLAMILGDGASEETPVGLLGCSVFSRSYQDTVWNRHAGTGHRIEGCHLYNLGEGGIILGGGDRITLTPGGNEVTDCHIHNYSRSVTTNRPAIWIDGVGNRAAHNHIHDAPHTAIFFWGNDHAVEYNDIHDVCRETGDVGAIYTGRDWTMYGNTVRFNFLHDIHGPGVHGAQAIYLDDQASGTTSFGNVIVNVARAFLIGGGRDNVTENNIMVNCPQSVFLDGRGIGWSAGNQGTMLERLDAVPYKEEPWVSRYPRLVPILDEASAAPRGNVVRDNVLYKCGEMNIHEVAREHGTVESNLVLVDDPQFVDPGKGDYRLKAMSPILERLPGFERIPFDMIGPREQRP